MLCAFPPLSLSLFHLTTWKVLFHLAKSCSSFKAFLNASGSKSFADIPATQGLLPVTSELMHISFTQVSICYYFVCAHARAYVWVHLCLCVRVHVCTGMCMCSCSYACLLTYVRVYVCACGGQKTTHDVIFINTIFLRESIFLIALELTS